MKRIYRPGILSAVHVGLLLFALTFTGCKPKTSPAVLPTREPTVQLDERTDPIAALADLSDPERLRTLKPEARAINGRLDKILYWLFVADQKRDSSGPSP